MSVERITRVVNRRSFAAFLLGLMLAGCAGVKPWQRERLSHPAMLMVTDPEEQSLSEHLNQYREAAAGGFGFGGGGCGCN